MRKAFVLTLALAAIAGPVLYVAVSFAGFGTPVPQTVVSTKPSPNGQYTVEELHWFSDADGYPYHSVVVRKSPPDSKILLAKDFTDNPMSLIFDWKDNSHLEINGINRDQAYKNSLPTHADNIDISYSDFSSDDYNRAMLQEREQIVQSNPDKQTISADKLTASFSQIYEADSRAPQMGTPPPPNICVLSLEAEDGTAFKRIGLVIKGRRYREDQKKIQSLDAYVELVEFWLGERVDHAYQPSIFDAFIIGADAQLGRGTGENQLRSVSWVTPGAGARRFLPFLRGQSIPVIYRTGLNKQLYVYELHTENIRGSLDRFRECIGDIRRQ